MQQVVNIVVLSVGELYAAAGAAVEQSPFVISLVVSRYSSHIGEEAGVRLLPLRSKLCEKLLEKHSLNLPTWQGVGALGELLINYIFVATS